MGVSCELSRHLLSDEYAVVDLQQQCHQSVEVVVGWRCLLPPSIHMLYDDTVTWQVWAAKKAHQPPLPCGQVLNQRLGEGHPDRKPSRAVILGRMRSEPHEWPAVYPTFALRATRGNSSFEDRTSSFFMALCNRKLHARNDLDGGPHYMFVFCLLTHIYRHIGNNTSICYCGW